MVPWSIRPTSARRLRCRDRVCLLTPSNAGQFRQGDSGIALDEKQGAMVGLVDGRLPPQRRRVQAQLMTGEIKQVEPPIELFLT